MENITLLKEIDFFKGPSTIELIKFNRICGKSPFQEAEEIVMKGDECNSLFIIKKGSVNVMNGKKKR
jgi:hypothetical protein